MNRNNLYYIWDDSLIDYSDMLPAVPKRASMVHNLIEAYQLLKYFKVVRSVPATYKELREFHSELYLDHIKTLNGIDDEYVTSSEDEKYGIGYDCPPVANMYELVSSIGGSSVTAAKCLILSSANIAINWFGGWHHAKRLGAEGFCYVNDIVLAIETLKQKFSKILYIDLDVHHGNGVQDAYHLSRSVFTLSFHKYEPGFFPGSGDIYDIGNGIGKGYSCNFPLKEGYSDETFIYAFEKVISLVLQSFVPDAIVLQCGADALSQDPYGGARLTADGYCGCVDIVLNYKLPTMLLGGGGYNHSNAARLWTSITASVAGIKLDENIPEHEHWAEYGPYYLLPIDVSLAKDMNTKEYIDLCIKIIQENLEQYLTNKLDSQGIRQCLSTVDDVYKFTE